MSKGTPGNDQVDTLRYLLPILTGAISAAIAPVSFVYRPGAVASGNVYSTWPALIAAVNAVAGLRFIVVDDSLAPANIPAGTWSVDLCTIYGSFNNGAEVQIICEEGAHLVFKQLYLVACLLVSASSTPIISLTGGAGVVMALNQFAVIQSNPGAAPFIHIGGDAGINSILLQGASSIGDGTTSSIQVDVQPSDFEIWAVSQSIIFPHAISGAGTGAINTDSSSQVQAPQAGGIIVHLDSLADLTTYTPASLPNWSGAAPTSVANAFDRIAAKIGPIA